MKICGVLEKLNKKIISQDIHLFIFFLNQHVLLLYVLKFD